MARAGLLYGSAIINGRGMWRAGGIIRGFLFLAAKRRVIMSSIV